MIPRYCTPEMTAIFSRENRVKTWLVIESKVASAQGMEELSDKLFALAVKLEVQTNFVRDFLGTLDFVEQKETRHDVAAFLKVTEKLVEDGRLHKGMTSSDLVDTANGVLMKDASGALCKDLRELCSKVYALTHKYREQRVMGRTHGRFAVAMSLGHKWEGYHVEIDGCYKLLGTLCYFGKLSGPVGEHSEHLTKEMEHSVLTELGLCITTCTQVVPRTHYADQMYVLARLMAVLERLAIEIRLSSRDETAELLEGFSEKQVGSSAMPHKRNPIGSENICGLSRMVRSMVAPALENVLLWQERDISHSSVERVHVEDAFQLTHYAVRKMLQILGDLQVNTEIMNTRAQCTKSKSADILTRMVDEGWSREEAHSQLSRVVDQAQNAGCDFDTLARTDSVVGRYV